MMSILTTEFWVLFQMLTIIALLVLLVYFIRHARTSPADDPDRASEYAEKIVALMEPFLNDAEEAARMFESQINEKKQLIRDLNEKLDSRIISLNLLLNRAEACLAQTPEDFEHVRSDNLHDTQNAILDLYRQGFEPQAISEKLSVPTQEVDLVITLKKKFISMEHEP